MADIKISEMEELLPYDDYLATGGVSGEDFLTILDIDETEPAKLNKKVKVSTILEKHALINSPNFTGNPRVPTPDIALNNTNNIVNVSWVVEKLQLQTLPDLADVTSNLNPQEGQTLVFDELSNKWKAASNPPFLTKRDEVITSDFIISNSDHNSFIVVDTTNNPVGIDLSLGLNPGLHFKVLNINNGSLNLTTAGTLIGPSTTSIPNTYLEVHHLKNNVYYSVLVGQGGPP